MQYSNILIIQTAFIGDAILASSLVEKLHLHSPQASISILVRQGNEGIYTQHPFLKEVLVWNKKEGKLKHLFQILQTIRKRRYDCVINCHRFASSGLLTAFSGARHKAGYKQNPFSFLFDHAVRHRLSEGLHETERYQQLICDFVEGAVARPRLYPGPAELLQISAYQKAPYVCFAPASVWHTKQLPAIKWIELAEKVPADTRIFLLGAPSDQALCEQIKLSISNREVHNMAGMFSLLASAEFMRSAVMNYVNDSAPLHLASAVNAPVTAFFCSTVPEFGFGPLSDHSQIIQVKDLPCKPCGVHGSKACPLGHFKCGHAMDLHAIN
jgi:heptosyltransferase-2